MADFPLDPKPDYPIEETSSEPEVLISTHKDGSEQRRYKGAGRRRTFRLTFGGSMPITNAQRLAIANHFTGQAGTAMAFGWTHPERGDAVVHVAGAGPDRVFRDQQPRCTQPSGLASPTPSGNSHRNPPQSLRDRSAARDRGLIHSGCAGAACYGRRAAWPARCAPIWLASRPGYSGSPNAGGSPPIRRNNSSQ